MQNIHRGIVDALRSFERFYRDQRRRDGQADPGPLHLDEQWQNFMNGYLIQVVARAREWTANALRNLIVDWSVASQSLLQQAHNSPGGSAQPAQFVTYRQRAEQFHEFFEELEDLIFFPEDFFLAYNWIHFPG